MTHESRLRLPGCIIVILACCLANVFAQATEGSILGTIFDPAGLPVPNATVTIKGTNTGLTRTTLSNEAGEYVVAALPLGTYSLTAQTQGFREAVFPNIVITVQARIRADLTLQIGETSESVMVIILPLI